MEYKIQIYMKKFIAFMAILTVLISCGGSTDKGELIGAKGAKWHPEKPFGMTLIPGGSFIMGKSDDDVAHVGDASTKTVTVRSFYMDETEITNSEYRQFVEWVKDSTMRVKLANMADDNNILPSTSGNGAKDSKGKNSGSIGDFAFNDADPEKMSAYEKYMNDNYYSLGKGNDYNYYRKTNKKVKLIKDTKLYPDELYTQVMLDSMYLPLKESFNGLRTIDVNKLKFRYSWMDIQAAVKAKKGISREKFIKDTAFAIYPDTTVWIKDFNYSYNEPMHNDYFWHKAYGDYPVVGVSWQKAKAFCAWRTLYKNSYIKSKKKGRDVTNNFRLPTEAEWEYSARGGLESATYPWGEAKSYEPNGFNLYNMAGNVSEWTDSSYDPNTYEYVSSMNPNVQDFKNMLKVVRGGSWKDVAYFLQVSTRDNEYADSARSYIGFRTIQDYMGTQATGKSTMKK
jgi:gliding motility-associated lipoprotein GldK